MRDRAALALPLRDTADELGDGGPIQTLSHRLSEPLDLLLQRTSVCTAVRRLQIFEEGGLLCLPVQADGGLDQPTLEDGGLHDDAADELLDHRIDLPSDRHNATLPWRLRAFAVHVVNPKLDACGGLKAPEHQRRALVQVFPRDPGEIGADDRMQDARRFTDGPHHVPACRCRLRTLVYQVHEGTSGVSGSCEIGDLVEAHARARLRMAGSTYGIAKFSGTREKVRIDVEPPLAAQAISFG